MSDGDGYSRKRIPEDEWPEELRADPIIDRFYAALQDAVERGAIGEGQATDEDAAAAYIEATKTSIRVQLELRGIPGEAIDDALAEIEADRADPEPGDEEHILRFDFRFPERISDWLSRPVVEYDPGVPPV